MSSPPVWATAPAPATTSTPAVPGRRVVAWLIDLVIVAALVGVVYLLGLIKINGCDTWDETTQTFAGSCPFEQVREVQRSDGTTDLVYVLDSGREISQDHPTVKTVLFGTRVVDPPSDATYLIGLGYVLIMFVGVQGLTGWTPGKALTGLRLVRTDGSPAGIGSALARWLVVDGAIGLIGVAIGLADGPWPLRLLAVDAAVGLLGGAAALGTDGRRPGDQLAGTLVVDDADAAERRRAAAEARPPADEAAPVAVGHGGAPAEPGLVGRPTDAGASAGPGGAMPGGGAIPLAFDEEAQPDVGEPAPAWPPPEPASVGEAAAPPDVAGPTEAPVPAETAVPASAGEPAGVAWVVPTPEDHAGTPEEELAPPQEATAPPHEASAPSVAATSPWEQAPPLWEPPAAEQPAAEQPAAEQPVAEQPPLAAIAGEQPGLAAPEPRAEEAGAEARAPEAEPAAFGRQPQWDEARQAYIYWDDSRQEWLQYDYAAQRWGPITRA